MTPNSPRPDTFYRFAVAAGMLLALFSLVWGRLGQAPLRERLMAFDEQQVQARLNVEEQQTEIERIEAYLTFLRRAISGEKNRGSQRFVFLTNETERTTKRQQTARIELDRRQALSDLRAAHASLLRRQMETDAGRSEGMAALGLSLLVIAFVLWYVRHQRFVDSGIR